jgi:hypothetical protein
MDTHADGLMVICGYITMYDYWAEHLSSDAELAWLSRGKRLCLNPSDDDLLTEHRVGSYPISSSGYPIFIRPGSYLSGSPISGQLFQ